MSISPPGECLYAIRMEPSPEARSTLEAAAHSIDILERGWPGMPDRAMGGSDKSLSEGAAAGEGRQEGGDAGTGAVVRDTLLRVLLRMVELQCAHITNPKHRKVDAKTYRQNRYNISALSPASQAAPATRFAFELQVERSLRRQPACRCVCMLESDCNFWARVGGMQATLKRLVCA